MPDDLRLTEEEKNLIINKHKAIVDELNNHLPDEFKLKYDDTLEARLNDEKEIKYYKSLKEASVRIAKQNQIYDGFRALNPIPENKNLLPRTFWYGLKTEDTNEARTYNQKLYNDYKNDPEKFLYHRIKRILDFNPQKLLDILDDKQKLVDFYLENQALCEDAFTFSSIMTDPNCKIRPEMQKAIKGITKAVETLSHPAIMTKDNLGENYFAFPKLTHEQALMIINSNPNYMRPENPYKNRLQGYLEPVDPKVKIEDFYNTAKDHGYKIEKGFFVKYEALEHNPNNNEDKEIALDDGIKQLNTNGNICVRERQPEEIKELMLINRAYENEYSSVWKRQFSSNYDHIGYDFERIKHANRGGFFERMFKTTSQEYREFITALKDYNDPNSPNYLKHDLLKQKAQNYFDYKVERGISFSKLDETERGRLKLVSAVIKTINDMEQNKTNVNNEIMNNLRDNEGTKEPVLKNDVDDNLIDNEIDNIIDVPELNNSMDLYN